VKDPPRVYSVGPGVGASAGTVQCSAAKKAHAHAHVQQKAQCSAAERND